MLIELGNESVPRSLNNVPLGLDDNPKVSAITIPEKDSTGLGGYTHKPGLSVQEFKDHYMWAMMENNGITRLPDHEILLSVVNAWPREARAGGKPTWVKVHSHEDTHGPVSELQHPLDEFGNELAIQPHSADIAQDIQNFLSEYWGIGEKPANVEDTHWTRYGPPGVSGPSLPDAQALFTNAGRVITNVNDGGGQVGVSGTGTAATATSLTTNLTLVTNAWSGYRVYAMQTATGPLIFSNVISNNNTAGASVLTLDRWYSAATPGGAAPAAPSAGYYFIVPDGGAASAWFIGMTTSASPFTPAATDTIMANEYAVAGGGMIRKISPYSQTSGIASRAITLSPVFTVNASDTGLPLTFTGIGAFVSMVIGATGSPFMKFETPLNASATVSAINDQVSVTETVSGS